MNFIQIDFNISPNETYIADVLAMQLSEIGFDTFVTLNNGMQAFVSEFNYNQALLDDLLSNFEFEAQISYTVEMIPSKNWNEEWEKHYFEPIVIDNACVIHSSFHKNVPKAKYDIVIDPKMSFGTGHHETTSLVIAQMLRTDFVSKRVLDMGCGTSILAILAAMQGAKEVVAVDIDPWCTENSAENIALNKVENVQVLLGGAEVLEGMKFDIILANINRNILLNDIPHYAACLDKGGELYMSGFYSEDVAQIEGVATKFGLELKLQHQMNNWTVLKTIKTS